MQWSATGVNGWMMKVNSIPALMISNVLALFLILFFDCVDTFVISMSVLIDQF